MVVTTAGGMRVALSEESCNVPTINTVGAAVTDAGGSDSSESAYVKVGLVPRPEALDTRAAAYVELVPPQLTLYATVSIGATLIAPRVSCEGETPRLKASAVVTFATRIDALAGAAASDGKRAVMLIVAEALTM